MFLIMQKVQYKINIVQTASRKHEHYLFIIFVSNFTFTIFVLNFGLFALIKIYPSR